MEKPEKFKTYSPEDAAQKHKKNKHSSVSKSKKRADHKHDYYPVIICSKFSNRWADRCSICGRIQSRNFAASMDPELSKQITFPNSNLRCSKGLSVDELAAKFPHHEIYTEELFQNPLRFETRRLYPPEENSTEEET